MNNVMLVVSAHAADFCSRAGGTLHKYSTKGWSVHAIILTLGERGESPRYWATTDDGDEEGAKALRRQEATAAAETLGVSIEFWDWGDYPLFIDRDRTTELAIRIKQIRPDVVLTHWSKDPQNVDHAETSQAVIRACTCAEIPGVAPELKRLTKPDIFLFEPTVFMTEFSDFKPDTYVDVTAEFPTKTEALQQLPTQPALVDWYTKYAIYRAIEAKQWFRTETTYAEAFKRYTPWVSDALGLSLKGATFAN